MLLILSKGQGFDLWVCPRDCQEGLVGIWQNLPSLRARGKRYDDITLVWKMWPGSPSSLEAGCVAQHHGAIQASMLLSSPG